MVVFVIAVDVFNFNRDSAGFRVAFSPTASRTLLAETVDEISANELIATVSWVRAALKLGCAQLKLPLMLAREGATQFLAAVRAIAAALLKP